MGGHRITRTSFSSQAAASYIFTDYDTHRISSISTIWYTRIQGGIQYSINGCGNSLTREIPIESADRQITAGHRRTPPPPPLLWNTHSHTISTSSLLTSFLFSSLYFILFSSLHVAHPNLLFWSTWATSRIITW